MNDIPLGHIIGGGPAGSQNTNVHPTKGPWNLTVVFVDTKNARYGSELPGLMRGYENIHLDTLRKYIDENSGGQVHLTISMRRQPLHLGGNFEKYFEKKKDGKWKPSTWFVEFFLAFGLSYSSYDSIVFVVKSPDETSGKFPWPLATIGRPIPSITRILGLGGPSGPTGMIVMPSNTLRAKNLNKDDYAVLSHELLHNMGLTDQYEPVHADTIGSWDIMAQSTHLPHPSLAHKLMLGWAENVAPINRHTIQLGTTELHSLHPVNNAPFTPLNKRSGIEHRIADGWNQYFEYRRPDPTHVGDQNLPQTDLVLATDVWSYKTLRDAPISRPSVLLAPVDDYGQAPLLRPGDEYHFEDRGRQPSAFYIGIDKIGPDASGRPTADVSVTYDLIGRPDPSIRPRPASKKRKWQSPDIVVENERSRRDPAKWWNVPWRGQKNTVKATIRNHGGIDAPGVKVDFYVMNYTVSNPPRVKIGSAIVDIAAGDQAIATAEWTPPKNAKHQCIVAEIRPYAIPGTAVAEINSQNNTASSNYSKWISTSASPSSRETAEFTVSNPLDEPAIFFLGLTQSNPNFLTFLSNQWVVLDAHESRDLTIMSEFSPKAPLHPDDPFYLVSNDVSHEGFVFPLEAPFDHPLSTGGLDFEVAYGKRVECGNLTVSNGQAVVDVWIAESGQPAPASIVFALGTKGGEEYSLPIDQGEGRLYVGLDDTDWDSVTIYYSGPPGYGDCEFTYP